MPKSPSFAFVLLAFMAGAALAQLPPAPTPVPGSPLDRPARHADTPSGGAGSPDAFIERPAELDGPAPGTERSRFIFATGFRVDQAGHVVSNRHFVDACEAVGVIGNSGLVAELRVVAVDQEHDLALLAGLPGAEAASMRAVDEPLQGEELLSYGFPLPGVLSSSGQLGSGMVTALTGLRNAPGQFQTDVPLTPGSSGSPLLDRRGQVVGVLFGRLNALRIAQVTGDLPANMSFAVRLAPLKSLLDAHGVRYSTGSSSSPQLNSQEIAARAREWTVPLACRRKGA
ncbi:MAG TPA: serine protease [Burkholderiaceae bacterium]|nr:serine protease [Burkholderiaceae bacterium]